MLREAETPHEQTETPHEQTGTPPEQTKTQSAAQETPPPTTLSQLGTSSITELLSASSISLAEADSILKDGGNFDNHSFSAIPFKSRSALRIAAHFSKDLGLDNNADFLKNEYLLGMYGRNYTESGKGFDFGNNKRVSAWFSASGIELAAGNNARNNPRRIIIPWDIAAARIDELTREGRYVSRPAFDAALDNERVELANKLWSFYCDDMDGVPKEWRAERGGHPEDIARIRSLLNDDNKRQAIRDRLEADVTAWSNNPRRRSWHNPPRLLNEMNESLLPPVIFPNDSFTQTQTKDFNYFITQDEIDAALTYGGAYTESKFRFLSFFLNDHSDKEKIAFIKNEYGHGGGTWNQTDGWKDAEPSKGLMIKRGKLSNLDAEANLKWNAVVKRMEQLINDGLYMTRAELDYIPNYERLMLIRQINNFYHDLPDEYERPFPGKSGVSSNEYRNGDGEKILDFHYPREAEWEAIRTFLDDTERIETILAQMQYICVNTPEGDRYYSSRMAAFKNLAEYCDGTYTLFPGIEKMPSPETAARRFAPITASRSEMAANSETIPRSETTSHREIIEDLRGPGSGAFQFGEALTGEQITIFDYNPLPALPGAEEQRKKIEQANEQANERINEGKNEKANDQTNEKVNEQTNDKTSNKINETANEQTAGANAPASSLPDDKDAVFLDISDENKARIAEQFADNPRSREAVNLVREIYGDKLGIPLSQAVKRIAELVDEGLFDLDYDPYTLFDEVRDELSERGLEVSGAVVEDAINEYMADGGKGDFRDVTNYVEEYLTGEPGREAKRESETETANDIREAETDTANDTPESKNETLPADTSKNADMPVPELDFDTVAQTVLERVMQDAEFVSVLNEAQGRAAIRKPLNTALETAVYEHQTDEPQIYNAYVNDDDFNDRLFDYVYRQSWESRRQREAEGKAASQTEQTEQTGQTGLPEESEQAKQTEETEQTPKPTAEKLLSQDGTDYYLFHLPENSDKPAALSHKTLSAITERADKYIICADVCYLTNEEMARYRMEFRKMPRDLEMLPEAVQDKINAIRPGYLEELISIDLSVRGFTVSEELITDGLTEYRDHVGNGSVQDIADFIETEFLTDEPGQSYGRGKAESEQQTLDAEPSAGADSDKPQEPVKPRPSAVVEQILSPGAEVNQIYGAYDAIKAGYVKHGAIKLVTDKDKNRHRANGVDALLLNDLLADADNPRFTPGGMLYTTGGARYPHFSVSDLALARQKVTEAGYLLEIDGSLTKPVDLQPATPTGTNYRITDFALGEGGAKTKFRNNLEAIKTLKAIEFDKRSATPDEQEVLSRYVGWGGIPQAFDPNNKGWENEYPELNAALSPAELESARASTLNAHYTSPTVIKAIYETIERTGFVKGNILEPSCGIGNFFGLLPDSMSQSKLYGVELDDITSRIAKQLYPKANISATGFENTTTPDSFFDIAIGNVPFGNYAVADKRYDKYNFSIHDYFFAKAIDQVRPGGIIAFITSKFTMDKRDPSIRKYIAQRAELLGAVRLPNDTFLKNAGTETTMDILFLQKRDRPLDIEPDWVHLGLTEDNIPVNRYFLDNPEMLLGTMGLDVHMNNKYGSKDCTACLPIPGADLAEKLKDALLNIKAAYTVAELDDVEGVDNHAIPADPDVKNFSYTVVDDKVYFRENSLMYPVELPAATLERIKAMITLRDSTHRLIEFQLDEWGDGKIKAAQNELSMLYDSFTSQYGLINSQTNSRAFNADNSYYLLCSLEIINDDGEFERKADIFTKRTIKPYIEITHADTASEALMVSIGEKACVDMEFMSELTGKDEQTLFNELRGVIYADYKMDIHYNNNEFNHVKSFDGVTYRTADEFLSGKVRDKLKLYSAVLNSLAPDSPYYENISDNVEALKAAQPKDLDASEITVRLGATWINPKYVQQFMYELLNTSWRNQSVYQVNYHTYTGEWQVTGKGRAQFSDVYATVKYGTQRMNAYQIIDDSLNLRDARVYDNIQDADGKDKRVLNKNETAKAQQKQELIKQAFKDWLWKDPTRRQTLVKEYYFCTKQ